LCHSEPVAAEPRNRLNCLLRVPSAPSDVMPEADPPSAGHSVGRDDTLSWPLQTSLCVVFLAVHNLDGGNMELDLRTAVLFWTIMGPGLIFMIAEGLTNKTMPTGWAIAIAIVGWIAGVVVIFHVDNKAR
jgi:hypothetical protein